MGWGQRGGRMVGMWREDSSRTAPLLSAGSSRGQQRGRPREAGKATATCLCFPVCHQGPALGLGPQPRQIRVALAPRAISSVPWKHLKNFFCKCRISLMHREMTQRRRRPMGQRPPKPFIPPSRPWPRWVGARGHLPLGGGGETPGGEMGPEQGGEAAGRGSSSLERIATPWCWGQGLGARTEGVATAFSGGPALLSKPEGLLGCHQRHRLLGASCSCVRS